MKNEKNLCFMEIWKLEEEIMKHPRKSYTNHAENRRRISEKWKLLSYSTLPKKFVLWKFEGLNKKSWTIPETGTPITQKIGAKFQKNGNFSPTAHYQKKFIFYRNLKAWIRNHESSSKQEHQSRRESAPNFRKMETSLLQHTTRKKFIFYGNLKAWIRNYEPSSKELYKSRRESAPNFRKW